MKQFSLKNFKSLLSLLAMTLVSLNSLAGDKAYYTNPNGWEQPYAHAWNSAGGGTEWPGVAMTWNNDKSMWEFEIPEGIAPTGILFHNNDGWQTLDLHFFANGIYGNSAFGAELFLRGTFNGWEATAQMKTANGVNYIIENYDFALTEEWPNFKFADRAWQDVNFGIDGGGQMTPGTEVTLAQWGGNAYLMDTDAGCHTAKINTQTGKAILLSHKDGAGKPQVEFDDNRVATFSSIYSTDLSSLPEDVRVYYASGVADGEVTLEEVAKSLIVAPNTGLYLFYTGALTDGKAAVEVAETTGEGVALAGNKLVAWAPGETCCASLYDLAIHNYTFGILDGGKAGFTHIMAEKQNDATLGKAYLQDAFNHDAAAGKDLVVRYNGDDPTRIFSVETVESKNVGNTIYNLNGQAVGENYKGIVIRNGKSIMKK